MFRIFRRIYRGGGKWGCPCYLVPLYPLVTVLGFFGNLLALLCPEEHFPCLPFPPRRATKPEAGIRRSPVQMMLGRREMAEHDGFGGVLLELLISELTPEGREILDQAERAVEAARDHLIGENERKAVARVMSERMACLPQSDQDLMVRIMDLRIAMFEIEDLKAAMKTIDRAVTLERMAGRSLAPYGITVNEAVAILERHGEGV